MNTKYKQSDSGYFLNEIHFDRAKIWQLNSYIGCWLNTGWCAANVFKFIWNVPGSRPIAVRWFYWPKLVAHICSIWSWCMNSRITQTEWWQHRMPHCIFHNNNKKAIIGLSSKQHTESEPQLNRNKIMKLCVLTHNNKRLKRYTWVGAEFVFTLASRWQVRPLFVLGGTCFPFIVRVGSWMPSAGNQKWIALIVVGRQQRVINNSSRYSCGS